MPMRPSLNQRFKMLKAATKIQRLRRETQEVLDDVRSAEGDACGYCGAWNLWKNLTDESTQTEPKPLICSKCVLRRQRAHQLGWDDWPVTH
jgi:hypothetical protein